MELELTQLLEIRFKFVYFNLTSRVNIDCVRIYSSVGRVSCAPISYKTDFIYQT